MAIGDSSGILFRIKSDYDPKGVNQAKGDINDLGAAGVTAGAGLSSLIAPATIAAVGIAAIGAAAVAAVAGLFRLTVSASEFGSQIFDASQKTGLSARTLSALKVAADTSGSSLEQVAGSVAKFNILLGQAANGNEKAASTLNQYKITATDTDKALAQAVSTIAKMTSSTQQAAAAQALFKDRTGEILPLIKSFDGDLPGLITKLEKLGVVMTDEDAQAADAFGDTLEILGTQAESLGRQFASEMMPAMTEAMSAISKVMAENQGAARAWGTALVDIATGVAATYTGTRGILVEVLSAIGFGFRDSANEARQWGDTIVAAAYHVLVGLNPVIMALELLRQKGASIRSGTPQEGLGGAGPVPVAFPKVGGGGGGGGSRGGGGGGASKKDTAEAARKKAVQAAQQEMQETLAIYKAGYDKQLALLDFNRENKLTSELNYVRDVNRIHVDALLKEMELNQELLENEKLNAEERKKIKHKILLLDVQISTEHIKNATKVNKQISEDEQKAHDEKLKRLKEEQEALDRHMAAAWKRRKAKYDLMVQEREDRVNASSMDSGGFGAGIISSIGIMGNDAISAAEKTTIATQSIKASWQSMKDIGVGAIDAMAAGIGSLVSNWVLMGTAGPNAMRKMVASVLAGVAAQSAILAIFELAKGFAALWWNPLEAAAHFKSAALFGIIAVGAAIGGRAIAGDSFSGAAGGGGGAGGTQEGQGNAPGLNFTERFAGFQNAQNQQMAAMQDRTNAVFGGVMDAFTQFNRKYGTASPGSVVMQGAGEASSQIFDAVQEHKSTDLRGSTQDARNDGRYR